MPLYATNWHRGIAAADEYDVPGGVIVAMPGNRWAADCRRCGWHGAQRPEWGDAQGDMERHGRMAHGEAER